jgi:hypothetical protein
MKILKNKKSEFQNPHGHGDKWVIMPREKIDSLTPFCTVSGGVGHDDLYRKEFPVKNTKV